MNWLKLLALGGLGATGMGALGAGPMAGLFGGAGPGLLANTAATNPALIESAAGTGITGVSSASPMGLGEMAKTAGGYIKPIGEAAGAAGAVRGLLAPQQPMMAPQMMQQQRGQDPIAGLLAQQQQLEEMRRKARYGIA